MCGPLIVTPLFKILRTGLLMSLFRSLPTRAFTAMQCSNPFCSEWGSCSGMEPPSVDFLSHAPLQKCRQFARALKVFKAWKEQRAEEKDGKCLKDLLDASKVEPLKFWLSRFVVEARLEDGKPSLRPRPTTLHPAFIDAQNLRHLAVKLYLILWTQNPAFRDLRGELSTLSKPTRSRCWRFC